MSRSLILTVIALAILGKTIWVPAQAADGPTKSPPRTVSHSSQATPANRTAARAFNDAGLISSAEIIARLTNKPNTDNAKAKIDATEANFDR